MFFFPCLFDYFIFVILLNDSYVFPKDTWTSFGMDDKLTLPGFLRFWMRGLDDCGDLPSWENQWQITSKLPPLRLIALFISYIWYVFFTDPSFFHSFDPVDFFQLMLACCQEAVFANKRTMLTIIGGTSYSGELSLAGRRSSGTIFRDFMINKTWLDLFKVCRINWVMLLIPFYYNTYGGRFSRSGSVWLMNVRQAHISLKRFLSPSRGSSLHLLMTGEML